LKPGRNLNAGVDAVRVWRRDKRQPYLTAMRVASQNEIGTTRDRRKRQLRLMYERKHGIAHSPTPHRSLRVGPSGPGGIEPRHPQRSFARLQSQAFISEHGQPGPAQRAHNRFSLERSAADHMLEARVHEPFEHGARAEARGRWGVVLMVAENEVSAEPWPQLIQEFHYEIHIRALLAQITGHAYDVRLARQSVEQRNLGTQKTWIAAPQVEVAQMQHVEARPRRRQTDTSMSEDRAIRLPMRRIHGGAKSGDHDRGDQRWQPTGGQALSLQQGSQHPASCPGRIPCSSVYFAGHLGHRRKVSVVPLLRASCKDAWSSVHLCTVNARWKLAAMWLTLTAYNLFKPYHIDDTAHLDIARWIAIHPLHPMSGTVYWNGGYQQIYLTNQPHLYFYLLALWGSLVGYGEPAMHWLQALFTFAAILLCYRITLQLVPVHAVWLTGMLAFSPSFAVEQNLMVDVPLLALWLLFFHALMVGADAGAKAQTRRFLVAALACSAALLVKYSSLVLLVILVTVIIYERRWRHGWAVLVPLVALGAWSLFNFLDYGGVHITQRETGLQQGVDPSVRRLVAWALTLGAITPLGLISIVQLVPWLHRRRAVIYAVTAALIVLLVGTVATGNLPERLGDRTLRAAFLGNAAAIGAAVALAAIRRLPAPRDLLQPSASNSQLLILLLWITGHISFYSLFAPFMAARHVLLVLPAVLLMAALLWPTRLARAHAVFGFAASVALSGALGWSDWHFAAFFRDEAATIRATLPPDARIWYTGHWGWQWYAERNGFIGLDVRRLELAPGDFLIIPPDVNHELVSNVPPPPPLVLVRTDNKPLGIGDIFCTAGPARFYATEYLQSPWRLTRACSNTILIYRVGLSDPNSRDVR
jgi:hypothetical protein